MIEAHVISIERFLKELGVNLDYTTKRAQRWSHAKLIEILKERGYQHLICGCHHQQENFEQTENIKQGFNLDTKILLGEIIQVKDSYGKIRHYRNPYQKEEFYQVDMVSYDIDMIQDVLIYLKQNHQFQMQQIFEQGVPYDSNALYVTEYIITQLEERLALLKEQIEGYGIPKHTLLKRKRGNQNGQYKRK